jgi:hypothetical protein
MTDEQTDGLFELALNYRGAARPELAEAAWIELVGYVDALLSDAMDGSWYLKEDLGETQ